MQPFPLTRLPGCRRRSRGFNFAEILFAVMILGIGFIMVAALFPVALQQTRLTGEEVVASTIGRGGVNYFQQMGLTPGALPVTDLQVEAARGGPAAAPPIPAISIPPTSPDNVVYVPGRVISFRDDRLDPAVRDALWDRVSGNLILPDDNRAAWVGMYRRGVTYTNASGAPAAPGDPDVLAKPDPFAHIILIAVNVRNRSVYEPARDLRRYPADLIIPTVTSATVSANPATLEPRIVYVKLTEGQPATGTQEADTVTFYTTAAGTVTTDVAAAAEGAYLVISDDQLTDDASTTAVEQRGDRNGRVYRLGVRREDLGTGIWELALDGDLEYIERAAGPLDDINENIPARAVTPVNRTPPPAAGLPAVAFLVGRGYADPETPTLGYEGPAQDTGVYVSIVPAN